jgi:hypothetical protein
MTKWIPASLGILMAVVSGIQLSRSRPPWDPTQPLQPLDQSALESGPSPSTCAKLVSTTTNIDIERAQARVRAAIGKSATELRQQIIALDVVLQCALSKSPTDGRAIALLAWTAWRTDAPIERLSRLIEASYSLHPFESNTISVRQLVIAANWDRLSDDVKSIGRADQSLRLSIFRPVIDLPELAKLYLEAGTSSDLYHEALDRIARTAPEFLEAFEAAATGNAKP